MENFITKIDIQKVRHLEDISIMLSDTERMHLVLTGKNGSGKTSVLEAIRSYFEMYWNKGIKVLAPGSSLMSFRRTLNRNELKDLFKFRDEQNSEVIKNIRKKMANALDMPLYLIDKYQGLTIDTKADELALGKEYSEGSFIVAYFQSKRKFEAQISKNVEKIELKQSYLIDESPRSLFVKYMLDLKTTEALADRAGKKDISENINKWFINFEKILKEIFSDEGLRLDFNIETFEFFILQTGKEPFGFNELSDGFAAALEIVVDLMMRMEKYKSKAYDVQGVVLIDEIETHLHISLQKSIMDILTTLFPRIQFIVTTHSPFIINSTKNAIIYDLEKQIRIEDASGYSYEGIVEHYFDTDMYSQEIKDIYENYKKLIDKKERTSEENEHLVDAITYLKQIPPMASPQLVYEFREMEEKRRGIVK